LYKSGKILGDINAVKRGTVKRRVTTRIGGNVSSRLLNKIVNKLIK
jgi:hypothetical protein